MMYLLDTCAFIWYIETSGRLPEAVLKIIDTSENIYLSQATFWEIAIKQLPLIHRDSFDRIIIATAIERDLTLLTKYSQIIKYSEVKTIWQSQKEEK